MSRFQYRPYVPVAQRQANARKTAARMSKSGRPLQPVAIEGRKIARTFWGEAWCDNLESYSDYSNRLPRGRTYVRNGSVIDLQIGPGQVTALVQGSRLYQVTIGIRALPADRWQETVRTATGQVLALIDLLQGRLPPALLTAITHRSTGLFPSPKEIQLRCSCPDWATMCKHVAATLYGVGARLDAQPDLFFTLRGVDMQDLIAAASQAAAAPQEGPSSGLAGEDLSALFGVELESTPDPEPATPAQPSPPTPATHPARRTKATRATTRSTARKAAPADPPRGRPARPGKSSTRPRRKAPKKT
ncbi:MAG: hypothetical protein ACKO3N_14530 [Verrucomicrobiota bacterium]